MTGSRMNHQSGRFIDNQDIIILINHIDIHRRGNEIHVLQTRLDFNGNFIAETHFFFWFSDCFPVNFDKSVFNQGFQTRAGNVF